jgi:hypothetical protein
MRTLYSRKSGLRAAFFTSVLGLAGLLLGVAPAAQAQALTWQQAILSSPNQPGKGYAIITATAVDASGNVFIVGNQSGDITLGTTYLTQYRIGISFMAKWNTATSTWAWVVPLESVEVTGLALSDNNVYITGSVDRSCTIAGTALTTAGNTDMFLAKFVDQGTALANGWAVSSGGKGGEGGRDLAVSGRNVYVTGSYNTPTPFYSVDNPTIAGVTLTALGGSDVFLAKYVDNGATVSNGWAVQAGGKADDTGSRVAVSGANVYVTGNFAGAGGSFAGTTLTNAGTTTTADMYLAKYVDTGTSATNGWAVRAGGSTADAANGLEASGSSLYLAGTFGAGKDFTVADQAVAGSTTLSTAFLAKYTDAGARPTGTWVTTLAGADATARGLALSGTALYVTGAYAGTMAVAGTTLTSIDKTHDVYVAKYVDNGASVGAGWAASGGGTTESYNYKYDQESGLAVAANGSVVAITALTGYSTAKFGPAPGLLAPALCPMLGQLSASTGTWQRVESPLIGSTSITRATATDASGNIFVAGLFTGNMAFGTTTLVSQGDNDFYVAKWSPATNSWAWAVSGGGPGADQALGLAVSGSAVYVTGAFTGSAYLAGTTLASAGGDDMFVAKYIDNGTTAANGWAVRGGGTGADQGTALAASGTNVYVTGTFGPGSPQVGGIALTSAGGTDMFLAKYVDNGPAPTGQWAVSGGGTGADQGLGLALSGTSLYLTGSFQGAGARVAGTTLASAGGDDIFVAKYVDNGTTATDGWAVRGGGTGTDTGAGVAVSGRNVYVTGSFASATNANVAGIALPGAGSIDMFVAKYVDNGSSATGTWATSGGGKIGIERGQAVAVHNSGVYVTGVYDYEVVIAGSALPYLGPQGLYLARFNDGGTVVTNGQAIGGGGRTSNGGYSLTASGNDIYLGGCTAPGSTFGAISINYPASTTTNLLAKITEAAPTISSFTPTSGYEGVLVTLNGTNLSSTSVITFGGSANNTVNSDFVVNSAGTQITNIIVPPGVQTGPISVATAGGAATSAGVFTVTPTVFNAVPTIAALSPASVGVGSAAFTLRITGTGFMARSLVRLNGVALATTLVSGTEVSAAVPASALTTAGSYPLTVTNPTPAGGTSGAATFTVTAPAISSLSPASGPTGTTITLTGSGLTGTSVITFAGSANNTVSYGFTVNATGTQITGVVVPVGAKTGLVRATTPYGTATSTDSYTVTAPVITSFTPTSGPEGTRLRISGLGFTDASVITFTGSSNNTVTTGFYVNIINSPGTLITDVAVPTGAQTGPISITTPNGTGTSTASFTVTIIPPPVITSFTPASGPVGTRLTINGTDLSGTSVITFTGSTANTVMTGYAGNGNQLTSVVVPAGAQTGPIQVTTSKGTASSVASFTVTNTTTPGLSSFSPASAPAGTRVTVTGTSLSGVTALTVNGVAVPQSGIFSLTNTSFAFVVPAEATATGTTSVATAAGTGTSSAFRVVLRAVSGTPAINGNRGAVANSAVAATFSEPVTGTAGLVVYSAQAGGRKPGTVSTTGSTVSFAATPGTPNANFKPGETINVTLPATTRTAANILASKQVYQFTTAARGTGRGAFAASSNPTVGAASWAITTGDVDGDGDLDLLTGDVTGTTVTLLRNAGNGTFGTPASITVGTGPTDLALADVDGDGDLDLLASNYTDNTVSVRTNNGAGTFSGTQTITLPANIGPEQLVLGDVDGDGDLDLLVGTGLNLTYTVTLRLNGGDATGSNTGIFSGGQSISVGGQSEGVALADVDGDGDLDVLAASITNGIVHIRLNGGDATGSNTGTFSGSGFVGVGDTPASIAMGDIDGDGDLDLLTANYGSSNVSVCFNKGNGDFINYTANVNVPVGSGAYNIALADVDADGDLDFLTSNAGYGTDGNTVSVRLNGGDATGSNTGTFSNGSVVAVGDYPRSLAVGDLDGDGDLDFATPSASMAQASVRLNGGTVFLASTSAQAPATFSLYPNPASRAVQLAGLPAGQAIQLIDALGRTVVTATADATGKARLSWPAEVASGVYIVRAGTQARRLTIE